MSFIINQHDYVDLIYSDAETEAVQIAITNLRRDLFRVLNCHINVNADVPKKKIYISTVGNEGFSIDTASLKDSEGAYRKEAFLIKEEDGKLYIIGTDRRGTIYGIYDFCEYVLGVSPWHFFADVPVREKSQIVIENGYEKADYPSVEYRGIFINDEEELEHWVQRYMGEETIGVKTYDKIFELLLRLKLNYIWPAMHVNSFNMKRENGELANRMGIVVGTSHCDMLMRSNNREWKPWLAKKGYTDVEYDYSIPGRNREILEEYWRESVEQNKDFEVSYTLGMRGIHDSGFETKSLAGKTGKELLDAKIELLDSVITAQQRMLKEGLDYKPLKNFVPYKEVLELYDNGLEVPEDLTLIWVNDNYGYVRRYPGDKEKGRASGNGIYYHNSYWAPPGASYLFICSIPMSHTRNELKKAYEEGIKKLWVTNFGAIKPLEQQLSFYAAFAWEAGREDALTDNEEQFLVEWINRNFSGNWGEALAPLLLEFDQLTNVRKIEHMDMDVFSQTAYGDEAAGRIHRYEIMFDKVNEIYNKLPRQERDAFFQMVSMKVHAAYYTNMMYYYADRSNLCMRQGKPAAADKYTKLSREFDHARRSMLEFYNKVMANGKWNGMLTPEDFPPPRTAIHPACMPPIELEKSKLVVTVWNEAEELTFTGQDTKWFEVASSGGENIEYRVFAPKYLVLTGSALEIVGDDGNTVEYRGIAGCESRILVKVLDEYAGNNDGIAIEGLISIVSEEYNTVIPVNMMLNLKGKNVENDGRVVIEAVASEGWRSFDNCWRVINNLGRGKGALLEGRKAGAEITYPFTVTSQGEFLLELHRFPTLNSVGRIRIGVSVDNGECFVLETESNDEHKGNWKKNVMNNVDKLYLKLPKLAAGEHTITFHVIDKYFSFSRLVIYTKERKENSLGYSVMEQALPRECDILAFAKEYYGPEAAELKPEKVLYMPRNYVGDTLTLEDIIIQPESYGEKITAREIVKRGREVVEEQAGVLHIEAASALAQSDYAYTQNYEWSYCNSPAHAETGLAMYIRDENLSFVADENAPSLNYRINTTGGKYTIWVRAFMWGNNTSHFTIGVDNKIIPEKSLYNGKAIWRYSNEMTWKWIPVYEMDIQAGEHILSLYSLSPRLRIEQIYITKGEEMPSPLA